MTDRPPIEVQAPRRWMVSDLNIAFFILALYAGCRVYRGGSLLLALQRLVNIALALSSGRIADRVGASRLLLPCSLIVAIDLGAIALGHVYVGTIIVIVSRARLMTVSSVLAAQRSRDRKAISFRASSRATNSWNVVVAATTQ
jgi:hypothetical protein